MTAPTVTAAVATRDESPVKVMWASATHFKAILPDHVDAKSFLGTAAAALYASEELMKCARRNPDSLMVALYKCAALGHQPGTDEYYLTPRKGGILGIEGYRGIIERMYRSGAVRKVVVREVCAKDKFRYVEGVMDRPEHFFGGGSRASLDGTGADFFGQNGSRDRGPMVGVYAYAELTTGAVSRVVILSRDDVMAAREASDAKDSAYSPWNRLDAGKDHPEFTGRSMWWKTAARRLEPWVPTSAEYRREQLRASAAAASAAPAVAGAVPAAGTEPDVVDGEFTDEPAAGTGQPAAPDAGPVSAGSVKAADTGPAQPDKRRAPPSSIAGLAQLIATLPLGPAQDADVPALLAWITGHPVTDLTALTRTDVSNIRSVIESHIGAAQGDLEQAVSALWAQYRAAQGGEPHEQGDGFTGMTGSIL